MEGHSATFSLTCLCLAVPWSDSPSVNALCLVRPHSSHRCASAFPPPVLSVLVVSLVALDRLIVAPFSSSNAGISIDGRGRGAAAAAGVRRQGRRAGGERVVNHACK